MLGKKVVLVTGSSRGIGRAIALACAHAGANIVVTYNKEADLGRSVVTEIRESKGGAIVSQLDVSSRESVSNTVKIALEAYGRIDVLINCAGILQQKPFPEITDKDWDRMFAVNLKGVFMCAQETFPCMQRQGGGRIINIASTGGQVGGPLAIHYSASKAGVISLTRSLARIGAPFNILVNCVSPGLIDTEMTQNEIDSEAGKEKVKQIPLQRIGRTDEVAEAAVFLASEHSTYITGQTINVNGGLYFG